MSNKWTESQDYLVPKLHANMVVYEIITKLWSKYVSCEHLNGIQGISIEFCPGAPLLGKWILHDIEQLKMQ